MVCSCNDSFKEQLNQEYNSLTPPAVVSVNPVDGATGVDTNAPITVSFNIPVKPSSINPTSFIVRDSKNNTVDGNITVSGNNVTFTHTNPFRVLRNYTVTLAASISNMSDVIMGNTVSFGFTVGHRFDEALELYLPFNGNSLDESGNEFDGIQYGNPTLAEDRFGNPDSAYYFDGVDDYIEIKNGIYLKPELITISIWVQNDYPETGKYVCILAKPLGITQYTFGFHNWSNYTRIRGMVHPDYNPATLIEFYVEHYSSTKEWVHRVATYDKNTVRYYVNGVEINSREIPGEFHFTERPWIIGWYDNKEFVYFRGRIDDVRIYSRVLSPDEIEALYHEGGWGE